jgi:hypothetical protein
LATFSRPRSQVRRIRELTAAAEAKIAPKDSSPRAVAIGTEIRALMRSLPEQDRSAFVIRALAAGDHGTVAAVLHAPPSVAGLNEHMHANLRRQWLRKAAPDELAAIALIERAAEAATKAGEALLRRYEESFDHHALDAAEGRASQARQAEAGEAA